MIQRQNGRKLQPRVAGAALERGAFLKLPVGAGRRPPYFCTARYTSS